MDLTADVVTFLTPFQGAILSVIAVTVLTRLVSFAVGLWR